MRLTGCSHGAQEIVSGRSIVVCLSRTFHAQTETVVLAGCSVSRQLCDFTTEDMMCKNMTVLNLLCVNYLESFMVLVISSAFTRGREP
jgi:hypothetical protein